MLGTIKKHHVRTISLILVALLLLLLAKFHVQITNLFVRLQTPKTITPKPKSLPAIQNIKPLSNNPVKAKPLINHNNSHSEKDLLNMQGYTIQLLGVYNFEQLKSFITANQLENTTYIFHSINKDKDWYTLIYGNYPTHAAAEAVLQQLPDTLKKLHPWIRPMDSVHTAILQGRQ